MWEHEGWRHGHRGRKVWNHSWMRDPNGRDGFWLRQEDVATKSRRPQSAHLLMRVGVGREGRGRPGTKNAYIQLHWWYHYTASSGQYNRRTHLIYLLQHKQVHSFNALRHKASKNVMYHTHNLCTIVKLGGLVKT